MQLDRICSRSFGQVYPQLRMVPRVLMRYWGGKVHIVLCMVIQGSHRESVYQDGITTRRDGQDTKILLYGHEKGRIAPPVSVIGKTKMCLFFELTVTSSSERHKWESNRIMRSIHFGSKDRSHSLVYQPLRITLSLCLCGLSPRSLKTIPCGETIYQAFCLYTSSLLRCHRASPPYFIVPPLSSFSPLLQPPLTACLIVFVRVQCILNALSRELTICAVESQTNYLSCLES